MAWHGMHERSFSFSFYLRRLSVGCEKRDDDDDDAARASTGDGGDGTEMGKGR